MLEPSPRLRKEASKIGCTPNHIIMADLILSGYTEVEAYEIASVVQKGCSTNVIGADGI